MDDSVAATPEPPAFVADQIVLSQINQTPTDEASSLPISDASEKVSTQAPETVQTETPPVETAPAPVDEFSFELPDATVENTADVVEPESESPAREGSTTVVKHADSPLPEDAPQWQHEAFDRLKTDDSISEEDKAVIAKSHPTRWDSMREWNKSHKTLGKFRNPNYPIDKVLGDLHKQSSTRYDQLKNGIISSVISDEQSLNSFAEADPESYSRLMVGLIRSQPDVLSTILSQVGYSLVKDEDLDVDIDQLRSSLMSEEDWDIVEGTPVEEKVKSILTKLERVKQQLDQVQPKIGDKEEAAEQNPASQAQTQLQESTLRVMSSWKSDLEAGIRAAGIVPPTEEEKRIHPSAARVKELAYSLAVGGITGKLPAWHEHLFSWGEKRNDFNERSQEVHRLLLEGTESEALSYARSVSSDVYEFGRLRGSIAYIKNLYQDANRLMNSAEQLQTNGSKPPEQVSTGNGTGDTANQSRFVSDALILGLMK